MSNYNLKTPMTPPWFLNFNVDHQEKEKKYIKKFESWINSLNNSDALTYMEMFPEPKGWLGFYKNSKEKDTYMDNKLVWNTKGMPKYDLNYVKNKYLEDEKLKYIFFWGHQNSYDGKINKSCFSQWWMADFKVDNYVYNSMEQYMMAEKARLFNDNEILSEILKSTQPKHIKSLGRKVKNFKEEEWVKWRHTIIVRGNFHKFTQNRSLLDFIVCTKNRILVEASPLDAIWGIKMAEDEKEIENPYKWKGLNLLGFALMEVRDEIISITKNIDKLEISDVE